MYYCEKCMLLNEGTECIRCGSRKLRAPQTVDFCFLDEQPHMWADMLRDVLKQNGIPSVARSVLGAGLAMSVGDNLDRHRIFVPYERYEDALSLDRELFADRN